MDIFEKYLLFSDNRHSNDVFEILNELDNHYIVKRIDTLRPENTSIISIKKEDKELYMYTIKEFLETSEYIGKSVYSPNMPLPLIKLYQDFIMLYKNDKNELLYDTIINTFFITNSLFDKEEMYEFPKQHEEYSFKKGLGKK